MLCVIINSGFGEGCYLSPEIVAAYNKLPGVTPIRDPDEFSRTDEKLVDIVRQFSKNTDLKIKNIPKKYKECFEITDYDGAEAIEINFHKYKLDTVMEILSGPGSNDYKVNQANMFNVNVTVEELEKECSRLEKEFGRL